MVTTTTTIIETSSSIINSKSSSSRSPLADHLTTNNKLTSADTNMEDERTATTVGTEAPFVMITSPLASPKSIKLRNSKIRVDTLKKEIDQVLLQQEDAKPLNANLESLTINKLHYDSIGMIGREPEQKVLAGCFYKLTQSPNKSPQKKERSSAPIRTSTLPTLLPIIHDSAKSTSHLDIVKETGPPKQLVFLKGLAGTGKSTLAKTLENLVGETDQGLLLEGKYDQKYTEPCSGILAAFGQIFQHLAKTWEEEEDNVLLQDTSTNIVDQLLLALGPEFDMLLHTIPYLEQVVQKKQRISSEVNHDDDESSLTNESDLSNSSRRNTRDLQYGFGAQQESIKYAFRILTRILSSQFSPLVLVLDDLQWADSASLEVVNNLLTDSQNTNPLMIVACYRANEVDSKHLLQTTIQQWTKQKSRHHFEMTTVKVDNFSVSSVHQLIRKLMGMEEDGDVDNIHQTAGLAELVHKRTLGNPHFVIQFMTMLYEESLLDYKLGLLQWKWNQQEIEKITMSTDNVVDILKARMKKLSPELQQLLKYAACLGASFSKETLDLVYADHSNLGKDSEELKSTSSLLQQLQDNDYIESREDDGIYVWVHDKVQEAALELIGESSKNAFQFEIGCILHNSLSKPMLEENLFTVVDLINQGNVKRRFDFAELNLRAARKAKGLSAFHSAASYVQHGVQLLPREKWTANFPLTLKLYVLGAQVELAVGNAQAMEEYYQEGISEKRCTTMDKLPLYISKINKLSSIDMQFKECVSFILEILKKFGCNLVWNRKTVRLQASRSLQKTSEMVKKLPKDFHQTQRSMTDPKQKAIMILLSKLWYICSSEGLYSIQCLGTTKMVQMTIEHGIHDSSGTGFATMGMALVGFRDDWEGAAATAETALLLQRRVENEYTAALTYFETVSTVFTWTNPLQSCLASYMDGFRAGMRSGNVLSGTWCLLAHHIIVPFILGKPLESLLARAPDVFHQLEETKQNHQLWYLKMFWQMLLNLSGVVEQTKELSGQVFDTNHLPCNSAFSRFGLHWGKLHLYNHYGDWESAAKIALEYGDSSGQQMGPIDFLFQTEAFHRGLALYAMARQSSSKKYQKGAKKALDLLSKWVAKGCPNVQHFYTLLKAEQASLEKKFTEAESLYKEAIVLAARPGLTSDAAIFNLRYSAFLLQLSGPSFAGLKDEAKYRLEESIRYYDEWGAKKIVAMLKGRLERWQ